MERPKGIRVMAVLHMILAASALLRIESDLDAMKKVKQMAMLTEVNPGSLANAYRAYASGASAYHIVDMLAAVVLAGLLVWAGVMLFKDSQKGRTLSLAYAFTSLGLRVMMTLWYAAVIHPKHAAFLKTVHGLVPWTSASLTIPDTSGWLLGVLVGGAYPLWVWWYMSKGEVRYYLED